MALRKESCLNYRREQVAAEDFLKEIEARCIWAGISNQAELGKALGVCQSSAGNYKRDPGKIRLEILQKMVKALRPDIGVLLRYLGYTNQEIRRFAKTLD